MVNIDGAYYECVVCYGCEFLVCVDCMELGAHYLVDSHELRGKNVLNSFVGGTDW